RLLLRLTRDLSIVLRGLAEVGRPRLVAANQVAADRRRHDVLLLHQVEMVRVTRRDEVADGEKAEILFGIEEVRCRRVRGILPARAGGTTDGSFAAAPRGHDGLLSRIEPREGKRTRKWRKDRAED